MRAWTLLALLSLAAAGANGDLFESMRLTPQILAELAGVKLAPPTGEKDGLSPCNITASTAVEDATNTCTTEIEEAAAAEDGEEEEVTDTRRGRGGRGGRGGAEDEAGEESGGRGGRGGRRGRNKRQAGGRRGGGRGAGRRGGGRAGGGRRGKPADNSNAIQQCVFQKLDLVDAEGNLQLDSIKRLISTYRGAETGKEIMIRMAELCFKTIDGVESEQQVSTLMGCIKRSMQSACPAHDLKMQNPALALITTKKAADRCLATLEPTPEAMWSGVRCGAEQALKMAEWRLEALTSSRKRRSPKRDRKGGKKGGDEEAGADRAEKQAEREAKQAGREAKRGERQKEQQQGAEDAMAAVKERAAALLGPLDEALEVARQGVLGAARCTYESAGALDGDDVAADKLREAVAEFGGNDKMKDLISKAIDKCAEIDTNADAMTECLNFELSVTCPSAMAPTKKRRGGGRGGGRAGGRRRAAAVPGRPAKVAALSLPDHLTP